MSRKFVLKIALEINSKVEKDLERTCVEDGNDNNSLPSPRFADRSCRSLFFLFVIILGVLVIFGLYLISIKWDYIVSKCFILTFSRLFPRFHDFSMTRRVYLVAGISDPLQTIPTILGGSKRPLSNSGTKTSTLMFA